MGRMKVISFKIDEELLNQLEEYMYIMYGDKNKSKRSVVIRNAIRFFLSQERKRLLKNMKRIKVLNI